MILLNTTFVIHAPLEGEFISWVKGTYLPSAAAAGAFGSPTVARVLTRIEPETESIAVQLPAGNAAEAQRWHDGAAAQLRDSLQSRWGDRIMFFTTYMEVL